ncbi:NADP-dependent oxidoreductase domain-containing protein [Emericellopsis atlantica]|uniref:NADP-dependent oxidoreductase domain-containing protein n=1 Tax=Emericellopsis atlantica TaxID=2614577 RepID=A0A9P8CTH0_9HYPO|nr:NADP-dependent oxidoreductase domain-containing protein [Emericellopsis atlantica]KAG9259154.1 NADP-dependent oxidoreductase domain-containing protein [Emericellopsis atlantica]
MSQGKKVTLNTGQQIPQLGYGTWQAGPGEVGQGVYEALKVGYRHLDFAKVYGNQREIADALKKAFAEIQGLKREDVFITSKLWNSQHDPKVVEAALDDCLEELGLDYLDLYLVHFPISFKGSSKHVGQDLFPLTGGNQPVGDCDIDDSISIVDTWKAMTKLPKSKTRAVGVSNHTIEHLEALNKATSVVPAANQVERHPRIRQDDLVAYCKEKNIHITAYSAFGNNMLDQPLLFTYPEIKAVAERLSKEKGDQISPTNVLIAWAQSGGHSVIPKSVSPKRIAENFKEIDLTADDIREIEQVDKTQRRYNIPYVANKPRWDVNIFGEEAETPATHKVII